MEANQKFNKLIILGLFIFCITPNMLYAQRAVKDSIANDSLKRVAKIIKTAKSRGRKLELNGSQRCKFIAENKNANSDLFKPTKTSTPDTTLLKDSAYVKTFRMAAYHKALKYKKRTVWHHILIWGGIYEISMGILVLPFAFSGKGM